MNNLVEALSDTGLTETEAKKALQIVFEWIDENYPVLAAMAKSYEFQDLEDEVKSTPHT
jgi:hypothetical protein